MAILARESGGGDGNPCWGLAARRASAAAAAAAAARCRKYVAMLPFTRALPCDFGVKNSAQTGPARRVP